MRAIALAVAIVVAAVLVVVALGSGGGESKASGLRIERTPGAAGVELIVYVDEPDANQPETASGKRAVLLECVDSAGRSVVRARHGWPFTDTDGDTLDPHVHQPVPGGDVEQADSCRLRGTRGPLRGEVTDAGIG